MGLDTHQHMGHKWALALLAGFVVACALFLLIQNLAVRDLRNSIPALSAGVSPAVDEATSAAATQSANPDSAEDGSSKERTELDRLTTLTSQLASGVAELEQMRSENEKLRAELARPRVAGLLS